MDVFFGTQCIISGRWLDCGEINISIKSTAMCVSWELALG